MPSTYPTTLDTFSNPIGTDKVNNAVAGLVHSTQHAQANDAIEALEAKVGATNSAVTTSHDYKLSEVTGSDKAVSKAGVQTLTNKDLSSGTNTFPTLNQNTTGYASALKSATTTVDVASATAPSVGQVLTATDSTHATWQTPINNGGTCVSIIPLPNGLDSVGGINNDIKNTNTTMHLGQVTIPVGIIANKISFRVSAVAVAGTVDLTMYSETGASQLFAVTTASISGAGVIETALSAVNIPAGNYYIAFNTNSTADVTPYFYRNSSSVYATTSILGAVTGKAVLSGTLTITAGTPPATITPTAITAVGGSTEHNILNFRLDN